MDNKKVPMDLHKGNFELDGNAITASHIDSKRLVAIDPHQYTSYTLQVADGKEVIKITSDGDLLWNGKKVETEDALVTALRAFLREAGRL
ncbi:hypothetical protein AAXE64_27645 [Priestia megaterium]